jgi:hypothetical protein
MIDVLSEVNLGRVTAARILLRNNDARLSFTTLAERYPNPFDDFTRMAETQKDALFKTVQIDALVRKKTVEPVPHCAPRHCAGKTPSSKPGIAMGD